MKMTNKLARVLSVVFAVVFAFSSVSLVAPVKVQAASLAQQKADIDAKIKASEKKIAQLKADKAAQAKVAAEYESQLASLTSKVTVIQNQKDSIDSQVATLNKTISSLTTQIEETEVELEEKTEDISETVDVFCDRLRANYMSGSSSFFEIFLQSGDISSFLNRLEMFKRVTDNDQKIVSQLEKDIKAAEELKVNLTKKREDSEIKKTELSAKKVELDDSIAEFDDVLVEIEEKVHTVKSILAKINGKINAAEDEAAAYKDDQADIIAAIKKAESTTPSTGGSSSGSSGGGYASGTISSKGWMWPVPTSSSYISSVYGYRRDPATGSTKFHYGIDIAAPGGSKIIAPIGGTVVYTKHNSGGYGLHLLLSHGNGYYTLYAHCSRLAVSSGQSVKQGQVIAYVGRTGYSTGNHLHFEVRDSSGNKLNPQNFVRK